jgi:heme exporter protein C
MLWKSLSVILIVYALLAGMLIPLKPGITAVSPSHAKAGEQLRIDFTGYNSFYLKSKPEQVRVWLQFDDSNAVQGKQVALRNDTVLSALFQFPAQLPKNAESVMLNAIIDHPADGVSLFPSAFELSSDTSKHAIGMSESWTSNRVEQLNIIKDISFPYRNVIYESIRNTYYHVPMWFALMAMFSISVFYSVRFLKTQDPDMDRKAIAFTEAGLLFGIMGLVTGMLWAHYTWGKAWSNDIKQLMTAVALLIYLAYFILRASFDEPEKGARLAAAYNVFAFATLIPLLYIVPRMFASLHPGSTGNPAFGSQDLDNTMRLVFYPSIIGFSLLGIWIAELRTRYLRLRDKYLGLN